MSPRDKGPKVFVKVDLDHGIALVSGERGREVLDTIGIPYRPSRKGKPRGLVVPANRVPDIEAYCKGRMLAIINGLPTVAPPKAAPVFIAPEPLPEPVPDPYSQGGLFGDAS